MIGGKQTGTCPHAILHVSTEVTHAVMIHALPLDELDGLEGFVHITNGKVETEVEHGVAGGLLAVFQTHKISEWSPRHHLGELDSRALQ